MTDKERLQFIIELLKLNDRILSPTPPSGSTAFAPFYGAHESPTFTGVDRDKLKHEALSLLMIK